MRTFGFHLVVMFTRIKIAFFFPPVFECLKIKKKKVPFQSKICCGKEALWKLLGGFQQSCGKDIQVGVVGASLSASLPLKYLIRDFTLQNVHGFVKTERIVVRC